MPIELPEQKRKEAINSIQLYFSRNMPEEIGTLASTLLLDFFLEEIGPAIYNQAVIDAQQRLQARIAEVDSELYADEFQYWPRLERKKRSKS